MSALMLFLYRLSSFSILIGTLAIILPEYMTVLIILALSLFFLTFIILWISLKTNENHSIKIETFENIDEQTGWIISVYLFFLLTLNVNDINIKVLLCILITAFFIFWGNKTFVLNPLLRLFGWHFYKITVKEGACYTLITKRIIKNNKKDFLCVQLSEYAFIEKGEQK